MLVDYHSSEFELHEGNQRDTDKSNSAKRAKLVPSESGSPTVCSSGSTSKGKELHLRFSFETLYKYFIKHTII